MIEEKHVEFDTVYSTGAGNNVLTIALTPAVANPNTVGAALNLEDKKRYNSKVVWQGDLVMLLKNGFKDLSFELNETGELIVNGPDANNYSLDAQGNLIYTYR